MTDTDQMADAKQSGFRITRTIRVDAPRALLTVFMASLMTACVSQGTYDALLSERDALQQENRKLAEQYAEKEGKIREKMEESQRLQVQLESTSEKLSYTAEELEAMRARAEEDKAMFDKLVKELSGELDSKQVTIQKLKDGINVNLTEDILFASGSATVRDSGKDVLSKVSEQLRDAKYQIIVSGFTDNVPISGKLALRYPSNWDLAAARATNVVRMLQQNEVPAEKLVAASFGENRPVASNETPDGRSKNRRIEIQLRPVAVE